MRMLPDASLAAELVWNAVRHDRSADMEDWSTVSFGGLRTQGGPFVEEQERARSGQRLSRNGQVRRRAGQEAAREWQACRRIGQRGGRISWKETATRWGFPPVFEFL